MHSILSKNIYFVKEQVGMFKASNSYDIFNPEDRKQIMTCREEKLGMLTKIFRFTDYKRMTPFNIVVKTTASEKVLTVKRGITFFMSKVDVFDEKDVKIGTFKQKFFSIGGKFDVYDAEDKIICTLKGKWSSWEYKFAIGDKELAKVSKKWSGIGKELFTSADNYILEINKDVPPDHKIRLLVLAAVMCIDMVLKE